jgi:sulfoxide reductase heme-binding subunit YedZ
MAIRQAINSGLKRLPAWPLYIILAVPGIWVFYMAVTNQLGADPLKALEYQLGVYTLRLLVAVLLVTPIRNILRINLIKYRRAIGLMVFFYALAHLMTYLWLDQQWMWGAIYKDITKRPYIIVGVLAFTSLLPLAVTSSDRAIKRLGPVFWRQLHRLVYVAAMGGAVHYLLLRKTWQIEPMIYVLIMAILLGYRVFRAGRGRFRLFRRIEG